MHPLRRSDPDFKTSSHIPTYTKSDVRRSDRTRAVPNRLGHDATHSVDVQNDALPDPETVDEALSTAEAEGWKKAMDDEYKSLVENDTWKLVDLPQGRKVISTKWIYKRKLDISGKIERYKARLVVKGCSEQKGIDKAESFQSVRYGSVRFLLAMAAKFDLEIDQMDVATAYLQGELKEEVFVQQPVGFDDGSVRVCLLQKYVYGLKPAVKAWNQKLRATLINAEFKCSKVDTCIYYKVDAENILIVALYVDDLIILSNNSHAKQHIKDTLKATFNMTDLGPAKFVLGIHIEQDREHGQISINQCRYISEILHKFNMEDCNPVSTPAESGNKLSKKMGPQSGAERANMKDIPYTKAVERLSLAAQISRPDIQFAVNLIGRFSNSPGRSHWNAVKRIFRYLNGTIDARITYLRDAKAVLHGFCDADWAVAEEDDRSVMGYAFLAQGGAISWDTQKLPTVASSKTEAMHMAMAMATQEATWLRNLSREIFPTEEMKIQIYGDNKSALMLSAGPTTFRSHYMRKCVRNGIVKFVYKSTEQIIANVFTRALPSVNHSSCCLGLNIG